MDIFLLRQLTQWLPKDFLCKEKKCMSADRFPRLNVLVVFTSCHAANSQTSLSLPYVSPQYVDGRTWRRLLNFHGGVFCDYCTLDCGTV